MNASVPASQARFPDGVLFDLDGTLLDSAPDMLATVNRMLRDRARPPVTLATIRPHVSRGARAMASAAFPELDPAQVADLMPEFLAIYQQELGRHSVLFDGVEPMLAALEAAGTRWGIVTNKPEYLARDIIPQLGWQTRCGVLVGGDTLAERKPHPLPLLHAAEAIGIPAPRCVYVGDDARDIAAARAAGMPSVVALWGYRQDGDDPVAWQGDVMIDLPASLCAQDAWPVCR